MAGLSDLEKGIVAGLLLGEGHFGGDGRQPQVVLKMHVRHERLLRWLHERFPGSKLYGPYSHGGRDYFQWMARGRVLARQLVPVLDEVGLRDLDDHAAGRYAAMKERYAEELRRAAA